MTVIDAVDLRERLKKEDPDQHKVLQLAALTTFEYDKERISAAEDMGVRVGTLDNKVEQARQIDLEAEASQGSAIKLKAPELWCKEVEGEDLINDLIGVLGNHLVLDQHSLVTIVFWVIHSHLLDSTNHSPRLNITAPEKGCGKTLVLDLIQHLTPKAIRTESLSTAVMFRLMDSQRPTLLVDEYDTFLRFNEELRGALNAGWQYGGQHMRCEGDGNEVKSFRTFGAVVLAGIKGLPSTLHDRSIVINMKRATRKEVSKIERFDSRKTGALESLNSQVARWADDHKNSISGSDPSMPNSFYNRTADRWRVLFSIADAIGGIWPSKLRAAAEVLESGDQEKSNAVMLLEDIQRILAPRAWISSSGLVGELVKIKDRPWVEYGKLEKPISQNTIARILKTFQIQPIQKRFGGGGPVRGYEACMFEDAFNRYISPENSDRTGTLVQPFKNKALSDSSTGTGVPLENILQANRNPECTGVPVENNGSGGDEERGVL